MALHKTPTPSSLPDLNDKYEDEQREIDNEALKALAPFINVQVRSVVRAELPSLTAPLIRRIERVEAALQELRDMKRMMGYTSKNNTPSRQSWWESDEKERKKQGHQTHYGASPAALRSVFRAKSKEDGSKGKKVKLDGLSESF